MEKTTSADWRTKAAVRHRLLLNTGTELFYLEPVWQMNAVEVDAEAENLAVRKTRPLFGGLRFGNLTGLFVTADSKRWLAAFAVEEPNVSPLILTTN